MLGAIAYNTYIQDQDIITKSLKDGLSTQIVDSYAETKAANSIKVIEGMAQVSGIPLDFILNYDVIPEYTITGRLYNICGYIEDHAECGTCSVEE